MYGCVLSLLVTLVLCSGCGATGAPVKHPNLFLNSEEIAQVREKIGKYEWASRLLDKVKDVVRVGVGPDGSGEYVVREIALCYVLTGEKQYGERARAQLLSKMRYDMRVMATLDLTAQPEAFAWDSWGSYAWAYDLAYDTFSEEERRQVEEWLRAGCKVLMEGDKRWTTTPNLIFRKHYNVGLVGYCLGDKELIEWGLNDPGTFGAHKGGFYPVMDTMIKDGYFWAEAPIYALHYDVFGMLALAEAALHYDGTDLYHYVSEKSGASIKSLIEGYLRMGYPVERTGVGKGSVRMATYGDGSTSYGADGTLCDTYLTDGLFRGMLEVAYKRYRDPAYAWLLSLQPARDANLYLWGYAGLTHGEPLPEVTTPPPAPSGVYPQQGFAFLRADESPQYWTSGALAAMVMLGQFIGHGHKDFYSLVLHGKGRLLYPDLNVIQYEPPSLKWTPEGIAHSTLLVDYQSPAPGAFSTSHEFTPEVKFFAITGSAFGNVQQTRRLLLTREYLADVFHAADQQGKARTFDWTLHGLGRLYPGNPAAYRPSDALVPYFPPHYRWVHEERGCAVDTTFQVDWIQRTAGVTEGRQFGPEWFGHEVGSRTTVLGVQGTEVYYGDGPLTNRPPHRVVGNPEPAAPLLVVRRRAAATTFAAVHEPYEGAPSIGQVRRLAEADGAIALAVQAPGYTDYLCVGFDDREHTLVAGGEAFVFTEYGYLRVKEGGIVARGKLKAFKVMTAQAGAGTVELNGKSVSARRDGEAIIYGELPIAMPPTPRP